MEETKTSTILQTESNINEIKFDILKIDSRIKKDSQYQEGETIFQFCPEYKPETSAESDEKNDYVKYIAKIKFPSFQYLGILSKNLKKESYGYNQFDNGDEYFGQWNKDKKEGYGIYYFNEDKENIDTIKQIYVGEFKNNVKSGEGIYFNISNFTPEKKPHDFNLAIGNFTEDIFKSGIIYSMKEGKRKIYRGKMNKDGKKEDDMGELYEDKDKIFFGVIKDNIMLEGRVIILKDNKKENAYYFTKKGKNVIDGDVDFEYLKWEDKDDTYLKKFEEINNIFDNEKIQELYLNIIQLREKTECGNNFDFIKNINYDIDVKEEMKKKYGKFLYC